MMERWQYSGSTPCVTNKQTNRQKTKLFCRTDINFASYWRCSYHFQTQQTFQIWLVVLELRGSIYLVRICLIIIFAYFCLIMKPKWTKYETYIQMGNLHKLYKKSLKSSNEIVHVRHFGTVNLQIWIFPNISKKFYMTKGTVPNFTTIHETIGRKISKSPPQ